MSSQLHGVVKDTTYDQRVAVTATDEEMPWSVDPTSEGTAAAAWKMEGEDARTQFWAGSVSGGVAA